MHSVELFIICFAASIIGAISGIGGGIIIKPLLDSMSAMSIAAISFLSSCAVFSMSIVSLSRSLKSDIRIEKGRGTVLAVSAAIGGVIGKIIFEHLRQISPNNASIGRIQNALLLIQVVAILFYQFYKSRLHAKNIQSLPACAGMGLLLGMIASFLGIGGGPINIFVLAFFFGMDSKKAALHSLYIIFFSQLTSLISTWIAGNTPIFDPMDMILMVSGAIFGAIFGRAIATKISLKATDRLFTWLLIFVSALCVYNLIRFS